MFVAILKGAKVLTIVMNGGDEIPEARRVAMKGVRLCIECQSTIELVSQRQALFNRRASKDSQLR